MQPPLVHPFIILIFVSLAFVELNSQAHSQQDNDDQHQTEQHLRMQQISMGQSQDLSSQLSGAHQLRSDEGSQLGIEPSHQAQPSNLQQQQQQLPAQLDQQYQANSQQPQQQTTLLPVQQAQQSSQVQPLLLVQQARPLQLQSQQQQQQQQQQQPPVQQQAQLQDLLQPQQQQSVRHSAPQPQPPQQQQPSPQLQQQLSQQQHSSPVIQYHVQQRGVEQVSQPQQQQQQQQQPIARESVQAPVARQPAQMASYAQPNTYHQNSPLYLGHNPFIEILRPHSYADDNIVTLNLSHSHIYEIDSEAFVGQRFEHIDLSNNKLGLIHSRSFRIGPNHSRHNPYNPNNNSSKQANALYPTRRPPPAHPKSVTIDFSHNPAIVALSGAFDHIDVPNCLLNFTNSTVELKFGAFKKYFKEHPGHLIDIESVDCCEQEWLLGYKHNFVPRTHCDHDPSLLLSKVAQQSIIDSCITYVTSARHSMTIQGPSIIHQVAAAPRSHSNTHIDNHLAYLILGGTAMILTSLSIYIIFYMFSLKAAFVYQMQHKS